MGKQWFARKFPLFFSLFSLFSDKKDEKEGSRHQEFFFSTETMCGFRFLASRTPSLISSFESVLESEFCLITTLREVEFGKKQGRKRLWFLSQLIHENRIHSFNTIIPLSAQFPSFEKKRRPEITEDFRASYIFRMRDSSFHACLGKQHSGLLHRRNGIGHTACAHKECADDARNDAVEHKGHKGLLQHLALTS